MNTAVSIKADCDAAGTGAEPSGTEGYIRTDEEITTESAGKITAATVRPGCDAAGTGSKPSDAAEYVRTGNVCAAAVRADKIRTKYTATECIRTDEETTTDSAGKITAATVRPGCDAKGTGSKPSGTAKCIGTDCGSIGFRSEPSGAAEYGRTGDICAAAVRADKIRTKYTATKCIRAGDESAADSAGGIAAASVRPDCDATGTGTEPPDTAEYTRTAGFYAAECFATGTDYTTEHTGSDTDPVCGRKCDRGTADGASAGKGAKTGEDTKRAFNLCQYIYFQTGQIKIICFGNYFRGNETNG